MAIVAHTVQVNGQPLTIWAETTNINYFLENDLEADAADGPSNQQVEVKSHTRRQYPGDPSPVNVDGSQREFLVDPSRRSGNALPGKNFSLKAYNAQNVLLEHRFFTYQGTYRDLHAYLFTRCTYKTHLYNHTGGQPSIIPAAD
jgi:hypothetical protein